MNRTAQIILNVVVGLVSLVFFVIVLFPLDSMISHYLSDLERQSQGKDGWRVTVSNIDASLIFDTEFGDLRLYRGSDVVFYAPRVSVGLSLLPLVSGTVNVSFKADYKRGGISGRLTLSEESTVDVKINDITFKEADYLNRYFKDLGYPVFLSGKVKGSVFLFWTDDLRQREAKVNLRIYEAGLKSIFLKDLNLELPALSLAQKGEFIQIDANMDRGRVAINRLTVPGPDFSLNLSGSAALSPKNEIIRMSADGSFSFLEDVAQKIPFLAMIEAQKNADGSYPVSLRGSFTKPVIKLGEMDLSQLLQL